MTDTDTPKPPIISRETLIPVGVAASCLLPIALGAMWIRDGMQANENAIKALSAEMTVRFNALEQKTNGGWSMSDMERWVLRLERDNPDMNVPDVRR